MTALTLQIKMDNAAFTDDPGMEAGRILEQLGKALTERTLEHGIGGSLRDYNGNRVGTWQINDESF